MEKLRDFRDLTVWQKAHQSVLGTYKMTQAFPTEERFALVSQMRRAAISIPANIAEGFKKRSQKDKANFYNIAQGSLEELRYYLILAKDLGYYENIVPLWNLCDEVGKMLNSLIKSLGGR
jgi:four helix bundle protein